MTRRTAGFVSAGLAFLLILFLGLGLAAGTYAPLLIGLSLLAAAALGVVCLLLRRLAAAEERGALLAGDLERAKATVAEQGESLRLLAGAARSAKLGYFAWDLQEDRPLRCSQEYAAMHGVTVSQYLAMATSSDEDAKFVHPDDRAAFLKAWRDAVKGSRTLDIQYRIVTPAGEVHHVREIEHSFIVENGIPVRSEGMIQDITDLRRAETLLLAAMNASATLFAIFDPQDRLVLANPAYITVFSEKSAPMEQGTAYETILRATIAAGSVAGSPEELEAWLQKRLERRARPAKDMTFQAADGRWFELSDVVLDDGHVFTIAQDVTERHTMEARLQSAQRMEAVGQLAAGMAHDFNNLLGIIQGNAELLTDRPGDERESVNAILSASSRAAELTRSLLAFSRRQPLRPRSFEIGPLIETLVPQFERSLEKPIAFEISVQPGLPPLHADPGQLENAVINLLLNAARATPGGGRIALSCTRYEEAGTAEQGAGTAGDFVCIAVEDSGKGMEPAVLAQAFEPFFTTDQSTRSSGLGLSMVYGFAKQSGGRIELSSRPGEGTRASLILPAARADSVEAERSWGPASSVPARGRGELILLLDDNDAVRAVLKAHLQRLGYRSVEAGDPARARSLLAQEPVDLALVDIMLSGECDGPQFVAEVRKDWPELKIVYISGYSAERAALDPGVPLLTKPFTRHALAETLDRAFQKTSAAALGAK